MDPDKLSRWLTLGANLAVLAGILLLILELQQNQEITRAQIRNEITQGELNLLALTAENRDLVEVLVRANEGQALSAADQYMYGSRSESVFRLWQNVHYQGRNGTYDDEEFAKHLETMGRVLGETPGLVRYWCDAREVYPEQFVDEINRRIPGGSCSN